MVEFVTVEKNKSLPEGANGRVPINLYMIFKNGTSQPDAVSFLQSDVKHFLTFYNEFVDEPPTTPLNYQIDVDPNGSLVVE
ncbi:MAG: hypothetical protein U5K54_03685 [Cytophagales bacterium]|nr:hypothetical protein [Cytophagales bacterium]